MPLYLLLMLGPAVLGLSSGAIGWSVWRRREIRLEGAARPITVLAVGVPVALIVIYSAMTAFPALGFPLLSVVRDAMMIHQEARFVLPLITGVVMVLLLAISTRWKASPGPAAVARRTPLSYIWKGWLAIIALMVVVILALTLGAGAASSLDDEGRYTMYFVEIGTTTIGTTIYGWHYSVPGVIAVIVLSVVSFGALAAIARPPIRADDSVFDVATRRLRSRNVLSVATGALTFHLAAVLGSLAGTSQLRGGMSTGSNGFVETGTPFAALGVALGVSAFLATAIGIGLWMIVLLSAVRAPRQDRDGMRGPATQAAGSQNTVSS